MVQYVRQASGLAFYKEDTWSERNSGPALSLEGDYGSSTTYNVGDVVDLYNPAGGLEHYICKLGNSGEDPRAAGSTYWDFHYGVIYPVTDLSNSPSQEVITEQGYRGQGSRDLNLLQGGAMGELSFGGWVYPDILGQIFRPVFGKVTSTPIAMVAATAYASTSAIADDAVVYNVVDDVKTYYKANKAIAAATNTNLAAAIVGGLDILTDLSNVYIQYANAVKLVAGDIVRETASSNHRFFQTKVDITSAPASRNVSDFNDVSLPYRHVFQRGDIPLSSTIYEAVGPGSSEALEYNGSRIASANLTFDSNSGVLAFAASGMSLQPKIATFPSLFSNANSQGGDDPGPAYVGWQGRVVTDQPSGPSINNRLVSAEINIEREFEGQWTARRNRDPRAINLGPIGMGGDLMIIADDLGDQFGEWEDFPDRSLSIEFSSDKPDVGRLINPWPSRKLAIQMSRANMANGPFEISRSNIGVLFGLPFMAVHNGVDAGPGQIIVESIATKF